MVRVPGGFWDGERRATMRESQGTNSRHPPDGGPLAVDVLEDPPDRGIPVVSVPISAGVVCVFRLDLLRLRAAVSADLVHVVGGALIETALSRLKGSEDVGGIQLVSLVPHIAQHRDGVLAGLVNRADVGCQVLL